MIRPRLKFETAEDRRKAAEKIRAEAEQVSFPWLEGLYCSYLLHEQTGGTTQIIIFKILRMIGSTAQQSVILV